MTLISRWLCYHRLTLYTISGFVFGTVVLLFTLTSRSCLVPPLNSGLSHLTCTWQRRLTFYTIVLLGFGTIILYFQFLHRCLSRACYHSLTFYTNVSPEFGIIFFYLLFLICYHHTIFFSWNSGGACHYHVVVVRTNRR